MLGNFTLGFTMLASVFGIITQGSSFNVFARQCMLCPGRFILVESVYTFYLVACCEMSAVRNLLIFSLISMVYCKRIGAQAH